MTTAEAPPAVGQAVPPAAPPMDIDATGASGEKKRKHRKHKKKKHRSDKSERSEKRRKKHHHRDQDDDATPAGRGSRVDGDELDDDDEYMDDDDEEYEGERKSSKRSRKGKRDKDVGNKLINITGKSVRQGERGLPFAADSTMYENQGGLDDMRNFIPQTSSLKVDHINRPLWVTPEGHIYMEFFSALKKEASDFLVAVAEPISRPEDIHEFQLTVFSLYAAVSVGISAEQILSTLEKFCKHEVPKELRSIVMQYGEAFGKVRLVLRDNGYFIEANDKALLELFLKDETIARARKTQAPRLPTQSAGGATGGVGGLGGGLAAGQQQQQASAAAQPSGQSTAVSGSSSSQMRTGGGTGGLIETDAPVLDPTQLGFKLTSSGGDQASWSQPAPSPPKPPNPSPSAAAAADAQAMPPPPVPSGSGEGAPGGVRQKMYSFEVKADCIGEVKEAALKSLQRPLIEEYDFKHDKKNPDIAMALRPSTQIRYYQERALRKMFGNGRARSGIIVLPCGAGKTLVGITAACTMRKSTVVLTSTAVAVDQWKRQFEQFTTIPPEKIRTLTAENKQDLPEDGGVLISTYTMMSFRGKRSEVSSRVMLQIKNREWGLQILDEVQFAPAKSFRTVCSIVKSHCKVGLTATLVREDDLIHDLQWLIGPKLYEANWLELQEAGFLAKVQCIEVWCPMAKEYFREYLTASAAKRRKLWVCNPNKLRLCEYLLKFHESRGDKCIVFSDNLFALQYASQVLKKPFICGDVPMNERLLILNRFQNESQFSTIFLSKVGDNAIDIPCATVIIQISFNSGSRRQEAQRLGRILRPKPKSEGEEFNAFFYSLVSKDTQEMYFADKRQQFIIDQGYAYKVITWNNFESHMAGEDLMFDNPKTQFDILAQILASDDTLDDIEDDDVMLGGTDVPAAGAKPAGVSVRKANLSILSGADPGVVYFEKGKQKAPAAKKEKHEESKHWIFKQRKK
ncbi:unnamed protein product [Vitrella brassicaformis CCMP3155]|uniref:DNA 3'-5' helicase n=3 Tax=Vitrella brassicaformis TaxID=1169539 RepID=A0A0G4F1I7_VITBC|nr:unnamed protein product [Vitrella brassicaformis CCMP3155]|eukprot:CEM05451.1 unnamed protein product [Vitrella brassicaformis CCMP3155]